MSAINYYLGQGYTPVTKTATFHGVGTLTIWTPRTSTRIAVTGIAVAQTLAGSTAFYFGNLAGDKLIEFRHAGSTTVESDMFHLSGTYDRTLVANSVAPGTDGVKVTVTGFELP